MALRDGIGAPISGANAAALHTILSNLMQNAVKYSGGAGNVELDLRCDGGNYVIAVSDHGPGIPPEECDAIFPPYWPSKQAEIGRASCRARVLQYVEKSVVAG